MPEDLVGASIATRYSSRLSGESTESGPEPLPASLPPTTISETLVSNGSRAMLRSVLVRSLMWPYTPINWLPAARFS